MYVCPSQMDPLGTVITGSDMEETAIVVDGDAPHAFNAATLITPLAVPTVGLIMLVVAVPDHVGGIVHV